MKEGCPRENCSSLGYGPRVMPGLTKWTGLGIAALAVSAAACGSTPSTTTTTTTTAPTTTTVAKLTTTTSTLPATTTTSNPNESSWADANTIVTGCTDSAVSGTLTNTGSVTNTYIVSVSDDSGSFELGTGNTQVTNLPPGHTTSWSSSVTFSNAPTGPVMCSVIDVIANY